jgi:hypothetical protein
MPIQISIAERIEKRIEKRIERIPIAGCWIWTDTLDRKGYARLSMYIAEKKHYNPRLAHRISYETYVEPIPAGMNVLHRCDTPACVNPHHLFVGSQADNIEDMVRKRRHWSAKMTHCKNGHELTQENVRIEGKNKIRRCKACEKTKKAIKYQLTKEKLKCVKH